MVPPLASTHWECHKCHCWAPRGGYDYCNQCGHLPPAGVTSVRSGTAKGAGKGDGKDTEKGRGQRRASGGAKSKGKGKGDSDAKVQRAMDAKTAAEAMARETGKAHKALQAEVKRLKEEAKNKDGETGPVAMDTESSTPALDQAVAQARDELKQMQGFSAFNRSLIPEFEDKLALANQKLNEALAARRAANPLRQQLEAAEAHQTRTSKKLLDAKEGLQGKLKALEEAQKAIDKQQAVIVEAELAKAKVDAEVAALAAQFASERAATAPTAVEAPIGQPDNAGGAPAEAMVSVALVNQEWEKNQLAWMAKIHQLEGLLENSGSGSTPSEPAQSEAGDLCSIEQLEDDAAWCKVEKGKRKAVLSRQRDKLAKEVKANLAKVSAVSSPFNKHG